MLEIVQNPVGLKHNNTTEQSRTNSLASSADNNHYHHDCNKKITAIKFYFLKIMYTLILLDMGLAPVAFQMWRKK